METTNITKITIAATINAPIEKVWTLFTEPEHISKWNQASDDWMTSKVENDLRPNGSFLYRMEAKNGSFAFDFSGVYDSVVTNSLIDYTLGDNRKVNIKFEPSNEGTTVTEIFEAEETNSKEMQQGGWQAILNSFKKYVEAQA